MTLNKLYRFLFRSHLNYIKTIYFNFRVFPFRTAIKFPIFLFGKVDLYHIEKGCIQLTCAPRPATIRIGGGIPTNFVQYCHTFVTYITLYGKMICGKSVCLNNGTCLFVGPSATLEIGDDFIMNANCKLFCEKSIKIGDQVQVSWDSQVFDSNFHFMVNDGIVKPKSESVTLGNNCWVGNRVTITKGTVLPPFSIVASNSIVNKNFSQNPEAGLYAGLPAKLIMVGPRRLILSKTTEQSMEQLFKNVHSTLTIEDITKL